MALTLEGRVAIITGSAQGIGRAIAERLAREGTRVLITDLPGQESAASEAAEAVRSAGGEAVVHLADVTKAEDVGTLVKRARQEWDRIDILVNNAGVIRDTLLLRLKEEDWDFVLTTNLKSVYLCSRAVLRPMMSSGGGRIVNISSVVGLMGNAGQTNYAASKAGMIGLTKSLAREMAAKNITVNAVAPGFIETKMTDSMSEEARQALVGLIPQRRLGRLGDVAGAVAFLVSDDAAYVTGQVLSVNGGMYM